MALEIAEMQNVPGEDQVFHISILQLRGQQITNSHLLEKN